MSSSTSPSLPPSGASFEKPVENTSSGEATVKFKMNGKEFQIKYSSEDYAKIKGDPTNLDKMNEKMARLAENCLGPKASLVTVDKNGMISVMKNNLTEPKTYKSENEVIIRKIAKMITHKLAQKSPKDKELSDEAIDKQVALWNRSNPDPDKQIDQDQLKDDIANYLGNEETKTKTKQQIQNDIRNKLGGNSLSSTDLSEEELDVPTPEEKSDAPTTSPSASAPAKEAVVKPAAAPTATGGSVRLEATDAILRRSTITPIEYEGETKGYSCILNRSNGRPLQLCFRQIGITNEAILKKDAVVNAANAEMDPGQSGTNRFLTDAFGKTQWNEAKDEWTKKNGGKTRLGVSEVADFVIPKEKTENSKIETEHLIQALGPNLPSGTLTDTQLDQFKEQVKQTYKNIFAVCREKNLKTVALPLISAELFAGSYKTNPAWQDRIQEALFEAIEDETKRVPSSITQITILHDKKIPFESSLAPKAA